MDAGHRGLARKDESQADPDAEGFMADPPDPQIQIPGDVFQGCGLRAGDEEDEVIALIAAGEAGFVAGHGGETVGDAGQQGIAGQIAVLLVDSLKIVQVAVKNPKGAAV